MSAIRNAIRNVIGADMYRPDSLPIYRGGGGGGSPAPTYATWSPTDKAPNFTLSNGDLTTTETGSGPDSIRATIGKSSGSGCFEFTFSNSPSDQPFVGVGTSSAALAANFVGMDAYGWGYFAGGGKFRSGVQTAYGSAWNSGDVLMVEVNLDTMIMEIFKNTVSQGTIDISALTGPIFPMAACFLTSTEININCGQSPFSRTPTPGITPYWSADA